MHQALRIQAFYLSNDKLSPLSVQSGFFDSLPKLPRESHWKIIFDIHAEKPLKMNGEITI